VRAGLALRLAACVILLAGCTALAPVPERPSAEAITRFAFTGRLLIRQGETRHHVRIDWRHTPDRDDILLTTPFGQGIAEIARDATGARLTLADKREFAAPDPDSLTDQVFGFRLPLNGAVGWLLGRPGEPVSWRVNVIERDGEGSQALPSLLELERDDILVRLKVDDWSEVQ